jgi:hypothetical protein
MKALPAIFVPRTDFWMGRIFPEAPGVRARILAYSGAHASSGPTGDAYRSTIAALQS